MTWSIPDRRRYLEDAKRTIEKSILRLQESCPHENTRLPDYFDDNCDIDYFDLIDKVCTDCGKVILKYDN